MLVLLPQGHHADAGQRRCHGAIRPYPMFAPLVSGMLQFFADVETFFTSVYFWIKLGLVGLLLLNGFLMTRTEQQLTASGDSVALWARMRTIALVSAVLWLATTLAGVVLKEFA